MEYPTDIQSFDLSAWDKRSFDSDARLNNNKPLNKIIQRPRSFFESVCVCGGGGVLTSDSEWGSWKNFFSVALYNFQKSGEGMHSPPPPPPPASPPPRAL